MDESGGGEWKGINRKDGKLLLPACSTRAVEEEDEEEERSLIIIKDLKRHVAGVSVERMSL